MNNSGTQIFCDILVRIAKCTDWEKFQEKGENVITGKSIHYVLVD